MANPVRAAQRAADSAWDAYLGELRAGAAQYVPPEVVEAARAAYEAAGGAGRIEVCGLGNPTHPVCTVEVRRVRR